MADLERLAHAKQIKMTLEDCNSCKVMGDDAQLGLLLLNLLDNAIRYTPADGRVSVTVRDNEGISLEVRDTGSGIAETEREQVQQRFYRITGSGEEGCGLGLSIVRRIENCMVRSLYLATMN